MCNQYVPVYEEEEDVVCPICGTVTHGGYCGACDKTTEE